MTRTVSATTTAAVAQDVTTPVYLIRMSWATEKRIATWAADITWDAETWTASGAEITRLNADGGSIRLPNGDGDPWLALVNSEIPRGRAIEIYEHHTSTGSPAGSDAELLFAGVMEDCEVKQTEITIRFIDSLLNKTFPHTVIDASVYEYLLAKGSRIYWGPDVVLVE